MNSRAPQLDPELESLLQFRNLERKLPEDVRARVLARSQALVSGRLAILRVAPAGGWRRPVIARAQGGRLRRLAIAAAIVLLAGTAGAVAALRNRAADLPSAAIPQSAPPPSVSHRPQAGVEAEPDPVTAVQAPAIRHAMTGRSRTVFKPRGADSLVEVELLQHAHLAYARHDFLGALALVAEHARRFPRGPLAEECEALRVESLLAIGHTEEARRAGVSFAKRFPRSVLLPRIEETSPEGSAP